MIRVVLDTNVVISSLLAAGPSQAILQLAFSDKFALFVTKPIIAEYKRVFAYPRLQIDPRDARRAMTAIRKHSELITPPFVLALAVEEEDNRFLECAQAAKANYLVTGNLRHFPKIWKYTRIIALMEFLRLWQVRRPLG